MVCPVSIAGNTRIASDILGTKIQDAFYSTAQLGENVVSNIRRPFPPWNLSMPWNYFENSLTVYLSKAYVSYHCLFLSALTDVSSAAPHPDSKSACSPSKTTAFELWKQGSWLQRHGLMKTQCQQSMHFELFWEARRGWGGGTFSLTHSYCHMSKGYAPRGVTNMYEMSGFSLWNVRDSWRTKVLFILVSMS